MGNENEIKYVIENNEDNINKLVEKGYVPFYSRQTGELEGYEFVKENILGANCCVVFLYDKENNEFVLDNLITIYGKKEISIVIADALLSLALESVLVKKEPTVIPDEPNEEEEIKDEQGINSNE